MLMNSNVFSVRDLQNTKSLLQSELDSGASLLDVIAKIDVALISSGRFTEEPRISPTQQRRPDNIIKCSVCGKLAVIVPLDRGDMTTTATHAIQCQNRPATDQPWRDGMCGHTEYIVRGDL